MGLRVVVIGSTGVFGSRAARRLAHDARFDLVLAGRRRPALEALRDDIGDPCVQVAELDLEREGFSSALAALQPALVIHTAGPFQGQDYRVGWDFKGHGRFRAGQWGHRALATGGFGTALGVIRGAFLEGMNAPGTGTTLIPAARACRTR